MTPSQIGRYRIESRLGAGGMGEVFLAEDLTLGRRVALKVLTPSGRSDDRARRFAQEARLASALNHPNIAQIFEAGEADGIHFIAMEYVEGEPLSARVQRGPLPPADVIEIAIQTFDALDEAHARGIIHRDLKPANILMTTRGRVKVLDFGLATRVGPAIADTVSRVDTDDGLILGTVHYMSPEQALGHDVDLRSDIFSAGIVLYELATGRLPFSGNSTIETFDRIMHAQPDPISRLNHAAPAELERIVKRALEKEPGRRYQSARDALIDLTNLKRDSDSDVKPRPARVPAGKTIRSLAVLPLATTTNDAAIDYLADGITESLINALSQIPKLKVMARSSVFRYKGRDVSAETVGQELGVRAVLLGRLQSIGERFIVRAELVDATDGSHIWGGQFQRPAADLLELQEELSREIVDQLRLKLTQDQRKRLQKRHTTDPRAYEAYMHGRFQLAKRTPEGFTKAIEWFAQAIRHDGEYALAHAGLADCYTLLAAAAYGDAPPDAGGRARHAAEQAIRLDAQLAEAHSALGLVRFRLDWQWAAAEASLKQACELNPGHAPAHHRFALLLSAVGRHDEALREIRTAQELDPLSLIIGTAYGRTLHFARRYPEAIAQFQRTIEVDDSFVQAHFDLGMSYVQAGKYAAAIAAFERHLEGPRRRPVMVAVLGHAYAMDRQEGRARSILAELTALGDADGANAGRAYIHAGLRELDESVALLERAYELHEGLLVFLKVEPMIDPLRSHPRFLALMSRMGLA